MTGRNWMFKLAKYSCSFMHPKFWKSESMHAWVKSWHVGLFSVIIIPTMITCIGHRLKRAHGIPHLRVDDPSIRWRVLLRSRLFAFSWDFQEGTWRNMQRARYLSDYAKVIDADYIFDPYSKRAETSSHPTPMLDSKTRGLPESEIGL